MEGIPFITRVALSQVRGWRLIRIFGDNHDVDAGKEDVWRYGGTKTWPTTAGQVSLVSSSVEDVSPLTGAWQVLLDGLDANYERITETVTLNGTTPVLSTNSFLRLNLVRIAGLCGSSGSNVGTITGTIGGDVQCFIDVAGGRSQMAHYTVEANHRLMLFDVTKNVGRGQNADHEIGQEMRIGLNGGGFNKTGWIQVHNIDLYEGSDGSVFGTAVPTQEATDIRWRCETSGNNIRVSVTAHGFLVEKGFEGYP